MSTASLKKELCDDKAFLVTIANCFSPEILKSEDSIQRIRKNFQIRASKNKDLEYEPLLLLLELHANLHKSCNFDVEDIRENIEKFERDSKKYEKIQDDSMNAIVSEYLKIISLSLKEKSYFLLNNCVVEDENSIVINKGVDIGVKWLSIQDLIKLCTNFNDFDKTTKNFAEKIKKIFFMSCEGQIEALNEEKNFKIIVNKSSAPINFIQNCSVIIKSLDEFLLGLFENKSYFIKKLKFSKFLSLTPDLSRTEFSTILNMFKEKALIDDSEVPTHDFSIEVKYLQEINSLIVLSDFSIIEVCEDLEEKSLSNLIKQGRLCHAITDFSYFLPKIKIPEATSKFIKIIYEILQDPFSLFADPYTKLQLIRSCITHFITLKSNQILSGTFLPNSICLFINSCKYLMYHLIVIDSSLSTSVGLPQNWFLLDLIYEIRKKHKECACFMLKQFKLSISEKLNFNADTIDSVDEKIFSAISIAEYNSILFCDFLSPNDSYKFVGSLLDFLLILILKKTNDLKLDHSRMKFMLSKIFEFEKFLGHNAGTYSKEYLKFSEIYTSTFSKPNFS